MLKRRNCFVAFSVFQVSFVMLFYLATHLVDRPVLLGPLKSTSKLLGKMAKPQARTIPWTIISCCLVKAEQLVT